MRTTKPFPSLLIRPDVLEPLGSFAEAQSAFLTPDPALVRALDQQLAAQKVGVVAHFYMDPELQGVLSALDWPYVHISDSLVMADRAVAMAEAGMQAIVVLGVDFMSENARAIMDAAGFDRVPVYRVAAAPIGCTLADAAASPAYDAYLARAAATPRSLHVVYINTSLDTKARAHHRVPTITCTSSNVVRTVLQAFSQVPGLHVWYGPDSSMGENLRVLFEGLTAMGPAAVAAVHPEHSPASVRALLDRFHTFERGTCIVHDLFSAEIVEAIADDYPDVLVTAHLEVPGEMFALALQAQQQGRGVVGSTADILRFIMAKVDAAGSDAAPPAGPQRLRFVLGTEAGMITPIVRRVQAALRGAARPGGLEVEIIFPVASEAVTTTADPELRIVPGSASAEGCSSSGGCATCPYMKMNSLVALQGLLREMADRPAEALARYHPRKLTTMIDGVRAAELGGQTMLHMRAFQRTGRLPDDLVADIRARSARP
jgi:quinolinate synthase